MTIHDPRALRGSAADILTDTPNEKRLVFFWAALSAGLALLTGLLSHILNSGIAGTGGLAGIGLRSILTTAQQMLNTFLSIALPFWTLGYQRVMLQFARREQATKETLLFGFRRFGPGLRLMLLKGLLFGAIGMFIFYGALQLLSFTSLADSVYTVLDPVVESIMADPSASLDPALSDLLMEALLPMMLICAGITLAVLIPISYRLRFSDLRIVDDPRCGARDAIRTSFLLTKGKCLALFKLDLRFWWFWLIEAGIVAVCYGDVLLPLLGITLPISETVAFWGFYVVAMVLQVVLYTAFHNRVSLTYALAYESLFPQPENLLPNE